MIPCPRCEKPWDPLARITSKGHPFEACPECMGKQATVAKAAREIDELESDMPVLIHVDLGSIGLAAREIRAEWGKVPQALARAIPLEIRAACAQGQPIPRGFGLGSDTGTGKTMAIAAMVRKQVEVAYRARLEALRHVAAGNPCGWDGEELALPGITRLPAIRWACWPDTVAEIRSHATTTGPNTVTDLARVSVLVLDDLGRERIKGSYVEDWAASQLDSIVSHRYRNCLPIIWTTNLTEAQLVEIYGAALVSRLTEDAPLVWIPGLPSLRLAGR